MTNNNQTQSQGTQIATVAIGVFLGNIMLALLAAVLMGRI